MHVCMYVCIQGPLHGILILRGRGVFDIMGKGLLAGCKCSFGVLESLIGLVGSQDLVTTYNWAYKAVYTLPKWP